MKAQDLEKGKWYRYTALSEPAEVKYLHETICGYLFTDGIFERELHKFTVDKYIEEIRDEE